MAGVWPVQDQAWLGEENQVVLHSPGAQKLHPRAGRILGSFKLSWTLLYAAVSGRSTPELGACWV